MLNQGYYLDATRQSCRYVGHATEWDEVIVDGDLQERKFIAFYVEDNQVLAAASSSKRDTETAAIEELMRLQKMPTADELRSSSFEQIYSALLGLTN